MLTAFDFVCMKQYFFPKDNFLKDHLLFIIVKQG